MSNYLDVSSNSNKIMKIQDMCTDYEQYTNNTTV